MGMSRYELSSFSFFQRAAVKEQINFFSDLVVGRTPPGSARITDCFDSKGMCHSFVTRCGIGVAAVVSSGYDSSAGSLLVAEAARIFSEQSTAFETEAGPQCAGIQELFLQFQH